MQNEDLPTDNPQKKDGPSAHGHANLMQLCGPFWVPSDKYAGIPHKSKLCLSNIANFYTPDKLREVLMPFNSKDNDTILSCRKIEFLCINYAKRFNVAFDHEVNGKLRRVNIAKDYTRWLEKWNRRAFDFFRRSDKIYFQIDGAWHKTSIGQAHLFYWADQYGVLDYSRQNAADIAKVMSQVVADHKRAKIDDECMGKKRKRLHLIPEDQQPCLVYATETDGTLADQANSPPSHKRAKFSE